MKKPFLSAMLIAVVACGGTKPVAETASTDTPGVVALDSIQMKSAGISIETAGLLSADTISLTGTVSFDAARVSHVGPRIQGRIRRVPVDIGTHVTAGDTLVVLDSPELGAAQAHWAQARVSRDLAVRSFERTERLYRDGIVSQRRRLEVEAEMREREAGLTAALQALSALGAEPDTTGSSLFVIRSPLSGEVIEKHATAGEVVGPESSLFIIGELNRVWLILDLYETDLRRVRAGLDVSVVADAFPDHRFAAKAQLISSVVDTVSRTVKLRVEIPNPDHILKPGMFARAGLALDSPRDGIGIPHAAVQAVDGQEVVFIPEETNRFRVRPVKLGPPRAGGSVQVLDGLKRGERIVVGGSFALKAHLQRGAGEP
jgi:cobalt-zinc-cadmium efflux system membrane fusion protein